MQKNGIHVTYIIKFDIKLDTKNLDDVKFG